MAFWDRVTALIAGGAVARAASDAATPVLEPVRQHAWSRNQLRVLDPATAAELVAQGIIELPAAHDEASRNGIGENRLNALYLLSQTVPSIGELLRQLNRKKITPEQFDHALAKHKIDPDYWAAVLDLANEKLDPVQLANAIHRGLIADPGLLAVGPPTTEGNVKAYPVYPINALVEALASGIDKARLGVLVGLMGLPMGPHEAAQAVFRGILTDADFQRAIAEGNTRNEWGEAIFEQTRQIPTARDFFENALRGYHTLTWAQEQAKRHGMSDADSLVIYQNQGRPMNVRNITQGLARGGTFKPEAGEITDPYLAAIVEGNLKPAYYDLEYARRYTYSVPFWWRTLLTSDAIDPDEAYQLLLNIGNPPDLARKVTDHFAGATTATADPHVAKAQTQLWNTTHSSYKGAEIDDATVTATLPLAGVDAASIPAVLEVWRAERALVRATLSAANIRTAYRKQDVNDATGAAWTVDEAVAALVERGWSQADAHQYLEIG